MKIAFRTNLDIEVADKLGWPKLDTLHYTPHRGDIINNTHNWVTPSERIGVNITANLWLEVCNIEIKNLPKNEFGEVHQYMEVELHIPKMWKEQSITWWYENYYCKLTGRNRSCYL